MSDGNEHVDTEHSLLRIVAVGAVLVGSAVGLGWMIWNRQRAKKLSLRQLLDVRVTMVEAEFLKAKSRECSAGTVQRLEQYLEKLKGYQEIPNDDVLDLVLTADRVGQEIRLMKGVPCDYSSE